MKKLLALLLLSSSAYASQVVVNPFNNGKLQLISTATVSVSGNFINNGTGLQSATFRVSSGSVVGTFDAYTVGTPTASAANFSIQGYYQGPISGNGTQIAGVNGYAVQTSIVPDIGADALGGFFQCSDFNRGAVECIGVQGLTYGQGYAPKYIGVLGTGQWRSDLAGGTTAQIIGLEADAESYQADGTTARSTGSLVGLLITQRVGGSDASSYAILDISTDTVYLKGPTQFQKEADLLPGASFYLDVTHNSYLTWYNPLSYVYANLPQNSVGWVWSNDSQLSQLWDTSATTGAMMTYTDQSNWTLAQSTNGVAGQAIYVSNQGTYDWGIHVDNPATTNNDWAFVTGLHGASDVALAAVADDTNNTAKPIRIWQAGANGNSNQNIIEINAATKWQDNTALGVFSGNYLHFMKNGGTDVTKLDSSGTLLSSGAVVLGNGTDPGQWAFKMGQRDLVKHIGAGAVVVWADSTTQTMMFNPGGVSSFTITGTSGTTTVGNSVIWNGPYGISDSGRPPAQPRYEMEPATVTLQANSGLTSSFITAVSTLTISYVTTSSYTNVSSMTLANAYFNVATSTSNLGRIQLNGSAGTVGQVLTSGGSGSTATWTTPSGAGSGLTYSSFSALAPITYNNGTGAFSTTLLSATTGFMGTLQAAQFPALTGDITSAGGSLATTMVNTQSAVHTWTSSNTYTNVVKTSSDVYVTTGSAVGFDEYQNGAYVATSTITWQNGNKQAVTLTANTTFAFNAPDNSGSLLLRVATGAGSFTGSWPAAVIWSAGTAPTITTAASKNDLIACYYSKVTTKYYCAATQNF